MDFTHERVGESALLLRFGEHLDTAVSARVHAARSLLDAAGLQGLEDIVPGYASLLLRLDPARLASRNDSLSHAVVLQRVREVLGSASAAETRTAGRLHRIPVCYGGDHGVDLDRVAQHLSIAADEIVRRHCAVEYQVAMLGFAPGFAYLLGMDPSLDTPRREQPRTRVPAGSIGIGGAQTGVYPAELPGGWQLIGRTPTVLFDASNQARPCLLAPGDRVRFEAIDANTFESLRGAAP